MSFLSSFYVKRENFYQSLSPVTRILIPLILMIAPFLFTRILSVIILLAVVIGLLLWSRVPYYAIKPFISIFYTLIPMITIAWIFFNRQGEILYSLGPVIITSQGIYSAILNVLKLIEMVMGTALLLTTMSQKDIIAGFRRLGFPYSLCLTLALTLRFLPTVYSDFEIVKSAQMSRGFELEKENVVVRALKFASIIIPMLVISIQRVENLAITMESRGLRLEKKVRRTFYKKPVVKMIDYLVLGIALTLFIVIPLIIKYMMSVEI